MAENSPSMKKKAPLLSVLRRRAEFLAVASHGKKWVAPGFIMQLGAARKGETHHPARYGLTATTKIGNAVVRNRARRRLRALAFDVLARHALPTHDYVLIARATTAHYDYEELKKDLMTGLKRLGVWRAKPTI